MILAGIAIVGSHRRTKLLAPFADPTWQIWSASDKNESELPRHDAWFELHGPKGMATYGPVYLEWLRTLPLLYMQQPSAEFPNAVAYPKDEMIERFGAHFFSSSITWMLALAISKSPRAIGLWGVECAIPVEYAAQRAGTLHFLELARELGIEVVLPAGCALANPSPLYGYAE